MIKCTPKGFHAGIQESSLLDSPNLIFHPDFHISIPSLSVLHSFNFFLKSLPHWCLGNVFHIDDYNSNQTDDSKKHKLHVSRGV